MPHPHYSLQEWLVDWEWWTMHVFPTFLEAAAPSLLEKVEAYFKIRYADDPAWRQARMFDAWRFVLGDLQNLLTDKVARTDPSGTLTLHPDLPTTLWLYFNEGSGRAAVDRTVLTPESLEEFGRLIRANLKTDSSSG